MKLTVTLTPEEIEEAAMAGVKRRVSALDRRRTDMSIRKDQKNYWEQDIQCCIAEMAVCLAFNQEFSGFVARGISALADAGPLEVRTVMKAGNGLPVKSKDAPHQILVLTRVKDNRVLIEGWATASEVRLWGAEVIPGLRVLKPDELHSVDTIGLPIMYGPQVKQYRDPSVV